MNNQFNGLTTVNIELSSRCNKKCWMCGRRKIDKDYPEIAMNYGDMEIDIVKKIAKQLPPGIVCQFHSNGESLLHPNFGDMVGLFNKQIKCINTNGKLIVSKHDEIIDNLDTLTISVVEKDFEGSEQLKLVREFLEESAKEAGLNIKSNGEIGGYNKGTKKKKALLKKEGVPLKENDYFVRNFKKVSGLRLK